MARIRIGVVGAGLMGSNHARTVLGSQRAELAAVIDPVLERARHVADPAGAIVAADIDVLKHCDAAIVASPSETHPEVALAIIDLGLPVLVEKPMALDATDVRRMIQHAAAKGVPWMCGFVERFNPVVLTCLDMIESAPIHIVAIRHSPATPRTRLSVVHDLLIHDIDLALRLFGRAPTDQTCTSIEVDGVAEVADCSLRFGDSGIATLSANRQSQRKQRALQVCAEDVLFELDLLRQDITVYRNVSEAQVGDGPTYRAQTIVDIPFVRKAGEPLALQLDHFLDLVDGTITSEDSHSMTVVAHEIASSVAAKVPPSGPPSPSGIGDRRQASVAAR